MPTGAITSYIDVAQLVLYAFWIFFAGLIIYLHRENKREGYPLESDRSDHIKVQGFPPVPPPKTYILHDGQDVTVPRAADSRVIHAQPRENWPGAPLVPTGDPMRDGVGPAAWVERNDVPDLTYDGRPKIVPLRVATDFYLERRDPDPRGMEVIGADGVVAGVVKDAWVDRSEFLIRYLEVEVSTPETPRQVLVPMPLVRIVPARQAGGGGHLLQRLTVGRPRQVRVKSVLARHFAGAPVLADPDRITFLEEDKVVAYFGGGHFYATPARQEPLL